MRRCSTRPHPWGGGSRPLLDLLRKRDKFAGVQSHVGVKICGVTCIEDALICAGQGVDLIGLIFIPTLRAISIRLEPRRSSRRCPRAFPRSECLSIGSQAKWPRSPNRVGLTRFSCTGKNQRATCSRLARFWLIPRVSMKCCRGLAERDRVYRFRPGTRPSSRFGAD